MSAALQFAATNSEPSLVAGRGGVPHGPHNHHDLLGPHDQLGQAGEGQACSLLQIGDWEPAS